MKVIHLLCPVYRSPCIVSRQHKDIKRYYVKQGTIRKKYSFWDKWFYVEIRGKKISEPQRGSLIHITNTPKYNCGVQRFSKPPQPILYF
jgi:hypothetical protein